jgi:hypothetical protein
VAGFEAAREFDGEGEAGGKGLEGLLDGSGLGLGVIFGEGGSGEKAEGDEDEGDEDGGERQRVEPGGEHGGGTSMSVRLRPRPQVTSLH